MPLATKLCRRRFLEVVGTATAFAGISALPGCGAGGNTQPTTVFSAGTSASYTAPIWKLFSAQDVIVALDTDGFYAFSDICTHAGCIVQFSTPADSAGDTSTDGNTLCACHHSEFLGDGSVSRGPASTPLPHFQVTISDGTITVDPAVTVVATTRVTG